LHQVTSKQANRAEGKHASKVRKIFIEREGDMNDAISDSLYYFNDVIDSNLDVILKNIYVSNPDIDASDYHFFIKNSITPNAACYGDGTFEINLGLFTTYDTDDELAYVICHEIAHKLLDHSFKKMNAVINKMNSKETKEEIKKVEKTKYGRTRAALAFIDELNFDFLEHSKEKEAEADSLGYVLFQKTKYKETAALSALKKLKVSGGSLLNYPIKLDSIFNFESYPFKSYWLEEEVSLFSTNEKIDDFSISSKDQTTHPEIDFRIEQIQKEFSIADSGNTSNSHIREINEIAAVQNVNYTIDFKLLDLAFYQLIKKHDQNAITDNYYYQTMVTVLEKVFKAKRNHELGKYIPHKNNLSSEKQLNKIRLFLHNLELNEIRELTKALSDEYYSKNPQNKPLKTNL